jgi:hypothetical protein
MDTFTPQTSVDNSQFFIRSLNHISVSTVALLIIGSTYYYEMPLTISITMWLLNLTVYTTSYQLGLLQAVDEKAPKRPTIDKLVLLTSNEQDNRLLALNKERKNLEDELEQDSEKHKELEVLAIWTQNIQQKYSQFSTYFQRAVYSAEVRSDDSHYQILRKTHRREGIKINIFKLEAAIWRKKELAAIGDMGYIYQYSGRCYRI